MVKLYREQISYKMNMANLFNFVSKAIMTVNLSIKANYLNMTINNVSAAIMCRNMARLFSVMTPPGK